MMTFEYQLNPAKVGYSANAVKIDNVSFYNENHQFIEVYYIKDDQERHLFIKIDDILLYEAY